MQPAHIIVNLLIGLWLINSLKLILLIVIEEFIFVSQMLHCSVIT